MGQLLTMPLSLCRDLVEGRWAVGRFASSQSSWSMRAKQSNNKLNHCRYRIACRKVGGYIWQGIYPEG